MDDPFTEILEIAWNELNLIYLREKIVKAVHQSYHQSTHGASCSEIWEEVWERVAMMLLRYDEGRMEDSVLKNLRCDAKKVHVKKYGSIKKSTIFSQSLRKFVKMWY